MVIVTEKKCLMVLVLISLLMVSSFLIFNVTTFLPSNMVLLQVDSILSNKIDTFKQSGINKTPQANVTTAKLKKEFSKTSAFQNMQSFNRNSIMVGDMSKKTQNDIITASYPSTNKKLSNVTYINPSNTNPATTQSTLVTTSVVFKTSSSIKTTIKPKRKYAVLTYDDPETYKGPIVQGWPPSRNRSIPLYIKENDSFSIIPAKEKLSNKELIVIVQSRPNAFEARQTNRDTWIKTANHQTSVIFLVGSYSTFSSDVKQKLLDESKKLSDLIMAEELIEDYSNLTLKTLYTLKFFIEADHFFETTPNYLMKVDDDTFVNLPKLYHLLTEDKSYKNLKHLLMGSCFCGTPAVLKVNPKTKYTGKWQVPTYMYNKNTYPKLLSGSGYVFTRATANCLYKESLNIPYFHLEDVHVTGFAADACGIERLSNKGFHPAAPKSFNPKKDILAHYVNSAFKRKTYKMFNIKR